MSKAQVHGLLNKFSEANARASSWDSHWRDVRRLVRIDTKEIQGKESKGNKRGLDVYDGTAIWAMEQLAAALQSYLTNPTTRWFNLIVQGGVTLESLTRESKMYLEQVADIMYHEYSRPVAQFDPMMHEYYLDITSIGTASIFQWYDNRTDSLAFRTFPIAEVRFAENGNGQVDTHYLKRMYTTRQIEALFNDIPEDLAKKIAADETGNQEVTVLHMVFPRTDKDFNKYASGVNKPFASIWLCEDTKEVIDESGFDSFPYHVARWSKTSGEIYGRSPAMTCLPDIKMLNQMSKTVIKAAQKVVDPPILVPDDGFMLPLNMNPGEVITHDAMNLDGVKPLETRGNIPIGLEMMNEIRERIIKSFFVDQIIRERKKERQSVREIMDERNEMLRQMAPMLGRLQSECLTPMLTRSFSLLESAGKFPEPPVELAGAPLRLEYVSPAAQAQKAEKAVGISGYMEAITLLAQVDPSVMDRIDIDAAAGAIANAQDVPSSVLRSDEEVAELRKQRADKEEQQEQAALIEQGAGTIKDLASAENLGGLQL